METEATNFCSRKCLGEYRKMQYLSDSNPNKRYKYKEDWFENINSSEKAWVLGWIASDGSIRKNGTISIGIQIGDIDTLKMIRDLICPQLPLYIDERSKVNSEWKDMVILRWHSLTMAKDICKHLGIQEGKKSDKVQYPSELNGFDWDFIRGYFEGDGTIRTRNISCSIASNSINMLETIGRVSNIPHIIKNNAISWNSVNCLDFLGKLYSNNSIYFLRRKKEAYEDICMWTPWIETKGSTCIIDKILFCKTDENAILPSKSRVSDSGYDLTIIKKVKTVGDVDFYDTCIKVKPPEGYYMMAVPRSSISKTGYTLANSVGIIDRSYRGSILVPLRKINKDAPDIELPCRIIQLIPCPIMHWEIVEVDNLDETDRGIGGFGSTNAEGVK